MIEIMEIEVEPFDSVDDDFHHSLQRDQISDGILPVRAKTIWYKCGLCAVLLNSPVQFLKHKSKHKTTTKDTRLGHQTISDKRCPLVVIKRIDEELYETSVQIFGAICSIPKISLENPKPKKSEIRTCTVCSKKFSSKDSLRRHIKYEHIGVRKFPCFVCEYKSKRRDTLQKHVLKQHGREEVEAAGLATPKIYEDIVESDDSIICDLCGQELKHKRNFKRHYLMKHPGKIYMLEKSSLEKTPLLPKSKPVNRRVKVSARKIPDLLPIPVHISREPHVQKTHKIDRVRTLKEKIYGPCLECGKMFTAKDILNRHMMVHRDERPFSCGICGKKFRQKHNVTTHLLIHTGERPFKCNFCGEEFRQIHHLKKHTERKHSHLNSNRNINYSDNDGTLMSYLMGSKYEVVSMQVAEYDEEEETLKEYLYHETVENSNDGLYNEEFEISMPIEVENELQEDPLLILGV